MVTWERWCRANVPSGTEVVTVERVVGTNGGGRVFGAPASLDPCVVQRQSKRVQVTTDNSAGGLVQSTVLVMAPTTPAVPVDSKITLADGTEVRALASAVLGDHGVPGVVAHQEIDCG